jgi:hypothetical protein
MTLKRSNRYHRRNLLGSGYLILVVVFFLAACSSRQGTLKPIATVENEVGGRISAQPILATFSELQADPQYFRDRQIRVTGNFILPNLPDCQPYSGPVASWALVSEELRLDTVGFDMLLGLAPEGLSLTVDGFFRQYEGPSGCGKEPKPSIVWYLEVTKIVQPNSLVRGPVTVAEIQSVTLVPSNPSVETGSEGGLDSSSDTGTPFSQRTPGSTDQVVPTPTPLGTGSTSADPQGTELPFSTRTPTRITTSPGTSVPSPTNESGTSVSTPTNPPQPTVTPTPTRVPDDGTSSPLPTVTATATLSGYPPPIPTDATAYP